MSGDPSSHAPPLDLLVVEGADSGKLFTLEGSEVEVGRGLPNTGRPGAIRLSDPTVSSHHASIRAVDGEWVIGHVPSARNPTLVGNRRISEHTLAVGDRIQLGQLVFEVRRARGYTLTQLNRDVAEEKTRLLADASATTEAATTRRVTSADMPTEPRLAESLPVGHLIVLQGVPGVEDERIKVFRKPMSLGRSSKADIRLEEAGVSRIHAEIDWSEQRPTLVHRSGTNSTFVNGAIVLDRRTLDDGDEIRLADQVVLRWEVASTARVDRSLFSALEEQQALEQEIEGFVRTGSFVDVDVVGSYGLKEGEEHRAIIVSFDRFRNFVAATVEEFSGRQLNSNGDEVMCYFPSPSQAVDAAIATLTRLSNFNRTENELSKPFLIRMGAHTGTCAVDLERGYAYSQILDIAGHLQKEADTNGLLVSEATYRALPAPAPFERAGELATQGIPTYRWDSGSVPTQDQD